ncbi:DUF1376 domain-containing protein [Caballeronia sp. ATUFL_M1_KS5A]|uniref:DUF1376 domain-containing protein n=1 Tax=Caballeronia sp. ATUFL_M1_KS5A TaxID=2921778 RepID=UPI002028E7C7|nr:DUF1376 domain-containing protein [Caballeronia sp. ATUFL_M1_KS5A]
MSLPNPLTHAECDLRDYAFMPLDVQRLRDSDLAALESPAACWSAVLLWCASWHQVPAASLPNDDRVLAQLAGFGRVVTEWKKVREGALRGWIECSDGRLYHPVVAAKAREAWSSKIEQRWKTECARIKKHNQRHGTKIAFPPLEVFLSSGPMRLVSGDNGEESHGTKHESPRVVPRETPSKGQEQGQEQEERQGQTKTKSARPALELPEWLPTDAWDAFVDMRKKIKAPLTEHASKLAIDELQKLMNDGHRPRAVLEQSTMNSWRGLFPIKANVTRLNGDRDSREAFNERENARAKAMLFGPEVDHAAR